MGFDPGDEKVVSQSKRQTWLLCLVIGLLVCIPYYQVGTHEFLPYDDPDYVVENAYVNSGLTAKGIVWAFSAIHAANWHPLTWLSHMLDCEIFGLNPSGHHLSSLLLHLTNTILLFLFLRSVTGARWRSAIVAVLFGVHPLHVESVAWISERKDLLSTLFWMLALLSYANYAHRQGVWRYLLTLVLFALGLGSKPMVVTLPCVLLLIDYWPLGRFRLGPANHTAGPMGPAAASTRTWMGVPGSIFSEKIPFFVLSAASCAITIVAQQEAMPPTDILPMPVRFFNAITSYVSYLFQTVWPQNLAAFYPHPVNIPTQRILLSCLLLIAISFLAVLWRQRYPYLIVGWLWYIGTLVPVIGLLQVGSQAMADRYTYIPLIGIFIMIAWGLQDLCSKKPWLHVVMNVLVLSLLPVLCWATHQQVSKWKDSFTLFSHAAQVTENNYVAFDMLGVAMTHQGRYAEALRWFDASLRLKPKDAAILNNVGFLMSRMGDSESAIRYYRSGIENDPKNPEALNNLGVLLAGQRRFEEAAELYRRAIRVKPHDIDFHYNLGISLVELNRLDEGLSHYRIVLEAKPDHAEANNNCGVALARLGRYHEAARYFSKALALKPDYAEAKLNYNEAQRLAQ